MPQSLGAERIWVGMDGSPAPDDAVRWAARERAQLVVVGSRERGRSTGCRSAQSVRRWLSQLAYLWLSHAALDGKQKR